MDPLSVWTTFAGAGEGPFFIGGGAADSLPCASAWFAASSTAAAIINNLYIKASMVNRWFKQNGTHTNGRRLVPRFRELRQMRARSAQRFGRCPRRKVHAGLKAAEEPPLASARRSEEHTSEL